MNRYLVYIDSHVMHLYYPNMESAQLAYPSAKIEIDTDVSYLDYIDKIKEASCEDGKLTYGAGYIVYRFLMDGEQYLDGIKYMDYSKHSYTVPILKTIVSLQSFYEQFIQGALNKEESCFARFNKKEFNKLNPKPIKFCKLNGATYYADSLGRIYEYESCGSIKSELSEWNNFHDEPNAVYAIIQSGIHNGRTGKWYHNEQELLDDFKIKCVETPSFAQEPTYEIIKIGYEKLHPDERSDYIRLPYYPIKKNDNPHIIVLSMCGLLKSIPYYSRAVMDCVWQNHFENVIKKYLEKK